MVLKLGHALESPVKSCLHTDNWFIRSRMGPDSLNSKSPGITDAADCGPHFEGNVWKDMRGFQNCWEIRRNRFESQFLWTVSHTLLGLMRKTLPVLLAPSKTMFKEFDFSVTTSNASHMPILHQKFTLRVVMSLKSRCLLCSHINEKSPMECLTVGA